MSHRGLYHITSPKVISKNLTIDGAGHTVSGNSETSFVALTGGSLTLKNMKITEMSASGTASVVRASSSANLTMENCVVTSNAGSLGSVYFGSSGTLAMKHCTVFNNRSGTTVTSKLKTASAGSGVSGGVSAASNSTVEIENSILVGNTINTTGQGTAYDLKINGSAQSGENNIIGIADDTFTAAESDKVGSAYSDYSLWLSESGTPIDAQDTPIGKIDEPTDGLLDMYGDCQNAVSGAVAFGHIDENTDDNDGNGDGDEESSGGASIGDDDPCSAGHSWNTSKPVWKWTKTSSGYSAKATFTCKNDSSHTKTVKASGARNYTHKSLKAKTWYKYEVYAYKVIDGKKVVISKSLTDHSVTSGGKYDNPSRVKVSKSAVSVKKESSKKISASKVISKGKKSRNHAAAIRYMSFNRSIATVSSSGKIKGVKKGVCYVYAVANNGVYKKVVVTVK